MSNSGRNTLVLGILLFLICAFVAFQFTAGHRKTRELERQNLQTQASVDSLRYLLSTIDSLRQEFILQEALIDQQSKLVLGADSPSVTFGYLLGLMNQMGANVDFDFAVADSQKTASDFHDYIISGKTPYASLLNFANQIEKQRLVMTVEDFSIGTEGAAKADTVSFSMILRTHLLQGGPELPAIGMLPLARPYTGYPLFMPRISQEPLPWDIDPSLLNVEDSRLIGISRGMAFFRDSGGIIRILSRGSKVAWGYLYQVSESAGKVVFRLNKHGVEENYTVQINPTP